MAWQNDNVHFQNCAEYAEQLVQLGKQFDMQVYTNRNHGIYGGNTRQHLYTVDQLFLEQFIMTDRVRKPEWLKINIGANERYTETKRIVDSHCLHTYAAVGVNMGECWGKGTATFMIGGDICTRSCKFCNTQTGRPHPLDANEPTHVAESIALMKLDHAVITSVDRDDLPDLGATHWARTIRK